MRELKIDPAFRDLLPELSKEKFEGLEKMILKEGYDGTPILIWNGYIVDGHHRYKIFKKHNIEFNIEEISLAKDCEKSDVMDWMITYQDVRRNMCEAERIYANDKLSARRIEEENKKKKLEGNKLGADITNGKSVSVQMDGKRKSHTSPTHTREQRAKRSKVSAGTIARYDTVMHSENDELKKSMLYGDVKIGTAYKQVIDNRKKENISNINESNSNESSNCSQSGQKADEQTKKICEFMKTERKGDYNYNIQLDINSLGYLFDEYVKRIRNAIFKNAELMKYITYEHCDEIISALHKTKKGLEDIIEKTDELKNEKNKDNE